MHIVFIGVEQIADHLYCFQKTLIIEDLRYVLSALNVLSFVKERDLVFSHVLRRPSGSDRSSPVTVLQTVDEGHLSRGLDGVAEFEEFVRGTRFFPGVVPRFAVDENPVQPADPGNGIIFRFAVLYRGVVRKIFIVHLFFQRNILARNVRLVNIRQIFQQTRISLPADRLLYVSIIVHRIAAEQQVGFAHARFELREQIGVIRNGRHLHFDPRLLFENLSERLDEIRTVTGVVNVDIQNAFRVRPIPARGK